MKSALRVRPGEVPGIAFEVSSPLTLVPLPSAMNAENLLRAICERHGLPPDYGVRLLPLIRRALQAPDDVRDRILRLVDGNLKSCAEGRIDPERLWRDLDSEVLIAVARVLHNWSPTEPMLDLGAQFDGLGGLKGLGLDEVDPAA